ncbi:MAG: trypsin-like peptidase domain-containing protein [Planctomycetota bacterium]|nr:trypsin-like peptidase domain-containing protein [Planctomycetota bacterium]
MSRPHLALVTATGLVALGITRHASLDGRIEALEATAATRTAEAAALEGELERTRGLALEHEETARDLSGEVTRLRSALATERAAWDELAAQAERLDALEAGADRDLARLVDTVEATASMVNATRDQLERFESRVETNAGAQWRAMVAPTVQLAGESTVGSGVLLPSRPLDEDPTRFRTLLLTSWHVVRDIRAASTDADCPVPIVLRDQDGRKNDFTASVVAHDVPLDAALLVLDTDRRLEHAAQLPSRERLRDARVFDPIVAVGCPLGNDPIPTEGHLSDLHHRVGGERFWMISAPTYIGNSGGGIYSHETRELVGIFSKIYTHGAVRPAVIPHMGLVTPLAEFYDWIDRSGAARVIETADGAAVVLTEE